MIYNQNRISVQMLPNQHGPMLYYQKYEARGKPMPCCIVLGGDPLISLAASTRYPAGVSEVDIAGALRREPVTIVQAKTVDLMVPATAEMVIEGMVYPNDRLDEGPFEEYHGQIPTPPLHQPAMRVTAITHRNNPIIPFSFSGAMKDDYACTSSVINSAELTWSLRDKGLLPVRGVYCPPEAIDHVCIISANMIYSNFSRQLSSAIFSERFGMQYDKVIVCDREVDPANASEVWQAIFHKMNPHRGVRKIEAAPGHALQSYLNPRERKEGTGSAVYFDTTWPLDWDPETEVMKKCSFNTIYPKEVQEKVLARWMTEYGYDRTEWIE
jgi:4-hydroxy-3-polyprenylbenzoate decarboxylase